MHSQMLEKIPSQLKKNWAEFALPKKRLPPQDAISQHKLQQGESILVVLVNGFFMPELSEMHKIPDNLHVGDLRTALQTPNELSDSFPKLDAGFTDGLFICVSDNVEITTPLHVLSLIVDDDEFITQPQHIVMLGKNSKLCLIEEYFSLADHTYLMNTAATILVGINAELSHYKIQHEARKAIHLSRTFVIQMQDSKTHFTHFTFGSEFTQDDLIIKLQEQGASCETAGFYHLYHDKQHINYHIDIEHIAKSTESNMLYKGILENKSRADFFGRVHVAKEAQKTVAYQANHNLLLSPHAEVYTKPILEIYADEVKCKHGATVGQLDQAALFYLCSRGIEKSTAVNMLLQGFAEEIVQRISHPGVKRCAQTLVQTQ